MPSAPLRVGIIGSTGFGGSYLTVELLNRGHTVIGLARNPQSVGSHERYIPRPVDINNLSFTELSKHFHDVDILVSEYGPHTAGPDALLYMPFLEAARKIVLAAKMSTVKYFLFVGGAGSLHVPGTVECCVDYPGFFMAYRRAIATSEAHISYMEERLGFMGTALRVYRSARIAQSKGTATAEDLKAIEQYEATINEKDSATDFIKAGRATYMFFDGRTDFKWSFVSPSALYRPGPRTGKYEISVDEMVLAGEQKEGESVFEGRLTGITVGDMSIAIADEIEAQKLIGKHWSAVGDLSEDVPGKAYLTLAEVEGGKGP